MSVGGDIYKRPFITIGFTAWCTMLPLAVTSTAGMIRRLGGRRWQLLHRLIYVSAIAGVVHYWWLVKSDLHRPETYAVGRRCPARVSHRARGAQEDGEGAARAPRARHGVDR